MCVSRDDCEQAESTAGDRQQKNSLKTFAAGIGSAGLLAVILVVWTGFQGGRSPAERAATSLVMPTAILWLVFFGGAVMFFLRRQRHLALSCAVLWLAVGVTFNGHLANAYLRSMEFYHSNDPASGLTSTLDAVVLLGGYAADNRFGVAELGSDGQRFLLAAQLWYSGKTKSLICTGTGAEGGRDPSRIGRELLASVGIPDEVIFEVPGLNTDQEMENLERFFRSPPDSWLEQTGRTTPESGTDFSSLEDSIGLVTTAVHLSRAMRLAEARKLGFTPLGCSFHGSAPGRFSARDLIPTAGAGRTFATALKEQLARIVGR